MACHWYFCLSYSIYSRNGTIYFYFISCFPIPQSKNIRNFSMLGTEDNSDRVKHRGVGVESCSFNRKWLSNCLFLIKKKKREREGFDGFYSTSDWYLRSQKSRELDVFYNLGSHVRFWQRCSSPEFTQPAPRGFLLPVKHLLLAQLLHSSTRATRSKNEEQMEQFCYNIKVNLICSKAAKSNEELSTWFLRQAQLRRCKDVLAHARNRTEQHRAEMRRQAAQHPSTKPCARFQSIS